MRLKLFGRKRSENGAIAQAFSSAVYNKRTQERKRLARVPLYGRSMVEMLGVLAIIGVLSVGGIAGYNKAMIKHRLNVHAHGVTSLLMNALDLRTKLDHDETGQTYFNDVFEKLNLIPDGFSLTYKHNIYYIEDNFKNLLWIYWHNTANFGGLGFQFAANPTDFALCKNIVATAKEFSEDLWNIQTYKYYTDKPTEGVGHIYGDEYCNGSDKKCISHLSFKEQDDLCQICDEKPCTLYVLWK